MAGIVYFQILGYIYLCIAIQAIFAQETINTHCPLACECPPETKMVKCNHGYWTELPNIPSGTNYTQIMGGNFGALNKPSSCSEYRLLVELHLGYNNITSIAEDAFECMVQLKRLTIDDNAIQSLPRGVFDRVRDLSGISLKNNNLMTEVIPALCTARKLRRIDLRNNGIVIEPGALECLGSLDHLSYIDLASNSVSGSTAQALQPLQNVTSYISVADCGVTHLEDNTFEGFKLQILDLSRNNLSRVPGSLKTMKELKQLYMAHNNIAKTTLLPEMSSVEVLDLSSNHMREFPDLNPNIRELWLSNNNLNQLTNKSLTHLAKLEKLVLRSTKINFIETGAFHNLLWLRTLDVGDNNIIDGNLSTVLSHFVQCPLTTLLLTGNRLTVLDEQFRVLSDKNKLKSLALNSCKVEEILPEAFAFMPDLETLNLSDNSILRIHRHGFGGLPKLKVLDLSDNKLSCLDGIITGLQNSPLADLRLDNNQISKISLQNITTLKSINLTRNHLLKISPESFQNLTSLQSMDLSSNMISYISNGALELPSLSSISLSDNLFDDKSAKSFSEVLSSLEDLDRLDLTGAPIGSLPQQEQTRMWSRMDMLEFLHIDKCGIEFLFSGMFGPLINLKGFYATSNRISLIKPLAFQNVSRLTELHLDRNSITYMDWEIFSYMPQLRFLSLSQNPLLCTCEALWIVQAVRVPHRMFVMNQEKLYCRKSFPVQTLKVSELDVKVLDCEEQWVTFLKPIGIGFAILVIMLFLYTTWHYRWYIRYTLFLARAGVGRYQEMQDGHDYTYDAFVAYSSKDIQWVKNQLVPNIDSSYCVPGFKLCIHDRDWRPGIEIVENIEKSIAESRRTIIVLSKDFAASTWCQFELAMALMRLKTEGIGKDRLLVILLNDVPAQLLTARITYILTMKTYLSWPTDPGLQEAFWKTLRKSLQKGLLYH